MDRSPGNRTARPLATIRLTSRVAIAWLAVSVVGFFVSAYAFGHVLAVARGRPLEPIVIAPPSPTGTVLWLLASGVLVALVVVLHETIHGFAMARFGNAPRFGIGVSHFLLPYAYAETEGTNYTRTQLIVVLLAPLALITAGGWPSWRSIQRRFSSLSSRPTSPVRWETSGSPPRCVGTRRRSRVGAS